MTVRVRVCLFVPYPGVVVVVVSVVVEVSADCTGT